MPRELLQILYQDADYVAISKPASLAVIPGRAEKTSVLEQLADQLRLPCSGDADPRLRVCHRIDKDTSGLVVFAKHRIAQQHLSHQFQNNQVEKEYLALVAGAPPTDQGQIEAKLAPHPTDKRRMAVSKHGRPALTHWLVEQQFRNLALLRVFPKTGKTHQIRVHLQSVGLPLAVDPLYNPSAPGGICLSSFKRDYRLSRGQDERPLISRLTLHAQRIRFRRLDGEMIMLEADLPKDFRAALNMLAKYSRAARPT